MRAAMADALIGIGTAEASRDEEGGLLEEIATALSRDAMKLLFSGIAASPLPPGCVRVDRRSASLLVPEVALVDVDGAHYLGGE
jgi:hypothetical protein